MNDNNKSDIEIVGITTVGTYPSWIDKTIASMYNHVDKIIVINGGYDIFNPSFPNIRLEREHNLIQKIDINNKILEYTPHNIDNISEIFNEENDELGRASNMTLSTVIANNSFVTSKPNWILKLDSDQILYKFERSDLENLVKKYPDKKGFRFAQYADYYRNFECISEGLPDMFTNDGSLFYKSKPNQRYGGQGSPVSITEQFEITSIRTSHMRRISPSDVNEYEYFLKRFWYHTFGPNSIMEHDYNRKTKQKLTNEEILQIAHKDAVGMLKSKGRKILELGYDERIPYTPPLVCQMDSLKYIKEGY